MRIICANAENLLDWFEPGEIKELYLNFSDPWPKARHAKRRLTHRNFLAKYAQLLGKGGHLRFKTDNRGLFDFSVEEFKEFARPKSIKERMVDKQKRVETQKKQTVMKHVSRRKEDIAI